MSTKKNPLITFLLGTLCFFSLLIAAAGASSFGRAGDYILDMVMIILFTGLAIFSGILTWRRIQAGKGTGLTPGDKEKLILDLAQANSGRLTLGEIATATPFDLKEAGAIMDELMKSGAADLQIASNGARVYVFPDFLTKEEKAASEPVARP